METKVPFANTGKCPNLLVLLKKLHIFNSHFLHKKKSVTSFQNSKSFPVDSAQLHRCRHFQHPFVTQLREEKKNCSTVIVSCLHTPERDNHRFHYNKTHPFHFHTYLCWLIRMQNTNTSKTFHHKKRKDKTIGSKATTTDIASYSLGGSAIEWKRKKFSN